MTELLITIRAGASRGRVVRTAPDRHSKAAAVALALLEIAPRVPAQAALEGPK